MITSRAFAAGIVVVVSAVAARGQQIRCMSLDQTGTKTAGGDVPSVTADGRYVVFESRSDALVDSDQNGNFDIFVRDRSTGAVERVSVGNDGSEANNESNAGSISDDGRFVVFHSSATNLVERDTNNNSDIFLRDRLLATTTRVSVASAGDEAHGFSFFPAISADGSCVAFQSSAGNLDSGDTNGKVDIFVRDLVAGTTRRVSLSRTGGNPNDASRMATLSGDGGLVLYVSDATNLVAGDTNSKSDVFLFDRTAAATTRVSVSTTGVQADGASGRVGIALSRDGSTAAFDSLATNLAAKGGGSDLDVFVRDLAAGTTECVSVRSDDGDVSADSDDPVLTSDGAIVAFASIAEDLVDDDGNGFSDVFLHDRATGTTTLIDRTSAGSQGDNHTIEPAVNGDATLVVFASRADNFADVTDLNSDQDVFVNDLTFVVDDASWSNYGDGWPGTLGVPAFTASAPPAFGTSLTLDVTSSTGFYTIGFVLFGLQQADLPTNLGGTLLVDFDVLQAVVLDPTTTSLPVSVPRVDALANVSFFLQVIEEDDGAARAFSFTPGLELLVGR